MPLDSCKNTLFIAHVSSLLPQSTQSHNLGNLLDYSIIRKRFSQHKLTIGDPAILCSSSTFIGSKNREYKASNRRNFHFVNFFNASPILKHFNAHCFTTRLLLGNGEQFKEQFSKKAENTSTYKNKSYLSKV